MNKNHNNSLLPFVSGFLMIVVILFIAYKLPCPSAAQYSIFRIILSISLAGFAVLLSGFFNLKYKEVLSAGGALAVFAFSYIYTPQIVNTSDKCSQPFDFTVFLQDGNGNVPIKQNGTIALTINNEVRRVPIDHEGSGIFKQIPFTLLDSSVFIQLQVDGWQFDNKKTRTKIKLSGTSGTLTVERDNSLCCISGFVRTIDGFLENAEVRIKSISTKTDSSGRFSLEIPPDLQNNEYKLIAEKSGYKIFEALVYPATHTEVEIILYKN